MSSWISLILVLVVSVSAERFSCDVNLAAAQRTFGAVSGSEDDAEAVVMCPDHLTMTQCRCRNKPEVCDGLDDDCDGEIDESATVDADEDGLSDDSDCDGSFFVTNNEGTKCAARNMRNGGGVQAVATCVANAIICGTPMTDRPVIACPESYTLSTCVFHSDVRDDIRPIPKARRVGNECQTTTPCPRCRVQARCVLDDEYDQASVREAKKIAPNSGPAISVEPSPSAPCGRQKKKLVCGGRRASLRCGRGQTIEILFAMFGRQDRRTCRSGNIGTTSCSAPNAFNVVRGFCEGWQSCVVDATSPPFLPDPCPNTSKYLLITYRCCKDCSPRMNQYACEGKSMFLTCPRDYVLDIDSAMYGRQNAWMCPARPIGTFPCSHPSSLTVVQGLCQDKPACLVEANTPLSFPTDPCPDGTSYLHVQGKCCSQCERQHDRWVCEGSTVQLKCDDNYVIRVLDASYGRHNRDLCRSDSSILTTSCHATNSLAVVSGLCDGQQSCSILAANSVFGDPCVDTYKYLTVKYECCKDEKPPDTPKSCDWRWIEVTPRIGDCVSAKPLKMKQCHGGCESEAGYEFGSEDLDGICECCTPVRPYKRDMVIVCADQIGTSLFSYMDFTDCACRPCEH